MYCLSVYVAVMDASLGLLGNIEETRHIILIISFQQVISEIY